MAITNGVPMHERFPIHSRKGTEERGVSMERSKMGTKKCPDRLSHPNQNTIIIKIIW